MRLRAKEQQASQVYYCFLSRSEQRAPEREAKRDAIQNPQLRISKSWLALLFALLESRHIFFCLKPHCCTIMTITGLLIRANASNWNEITSATCNNYYPASIASLLNCRYLQVAPMANYKVCMYCDEESLLKPNPVKNVLASQLTRNRTIIHGDVWICYTTDEHGLDVSLIDENHSLQDWIGFNAARLRSICREEEITINGTYNANP